MGELLSQNDVICLCFPSATQCSSILGVVLFTVDVVAIVDVAPAAALTAIKYCFGH